MNIIDIIEKKKQGLELNENEIEFFISGVTNNTIADYQISAFLMAVYFTGMKIEETTLFTKYMAESGEIMDLTDISKDIVDKHSTGGVGDKITLIFLPLMAATGAYIAKLSGRGLGHTGGTIDKLESIPNFKTDLSISEFKEKVKEYHAAIISQTFELAPADGKLYALRDVTATVNIIPLIASSVVSKKIASGANHIVLDVKYGSGAVVKSKQTAEQLAQIMVEIGKRLGRNIHAIVSDMNRPLGRAVGNSLEIIEAIEFLKGNMDSDLKELTYELCFHALNSLGRNLTKDECNNYLDNLIQSGKALEKFKEIIYSQNGDTKVIDDYTILPQAKIQVEIKSQKNGFINNVDALKIAKASKILGAGRKSKTDLIDYSAGVYLTKKYPEYVNKDDTIAIIYTNNQKAIPQAIDFVNNAYEISHNKPTLTKIF